MGPPKIVLRRFRFFTRRDEKPIDVLVLRNRTTIGFLITGQGLDDDFPIIVNQVEVTPHNAFREFEHFVEAVITSPYHKCLATIEPGKTGDARYETVRIYQDPILCDDISSRIYWNIAIIGVTSCCLGQALLPFPKTRLGPVHRPASAPP